MADVLTRVGSSLIQHGPESDRVYGMRMAEEDMPAILDELEEMAREEGYGKLFVKSPRRFHAEFHARGYTCEAMVPHFYGPGEDGVFMGKFLDPGRTVPTRPQRVKKVLRVAEAEGKEVSTESGFPEAKEVVSPSGENRHGERTALESPVPGIRIREATPADADALAACYDEVFDSYPFPINDPRHLRREQEGGTQFFTAWEGEALVAAASMEAGGAPGTVEMTDFATLPSQRGKGLATHLLAVMDRTAVRTGKRVAYTIARAVSFGMNITFARRGYLFAGTLVNNTQISGDIESMNVWYKLLSSPTTTSRS
jgi:putative beta-lysine N-acetyltransferase